MTTAIEKLIQHIDQLALWLRDNPKTPMPSQHKKRAIAVLNKIINAEELIDDEWKKFCGANLNEANVENLKKECKEQKSGRKKKNLNPLNKTTDSKNQQPQNQNPKKNPRARIKYNPMETNRRKH